MNENSSCAKVSTPEPAQHLSISAVKNGWLVGVDANYASGCLGKPYVYTRPEEVAGAVLGLIVAGIPLSGVGIPNETPAAVAHAYNEGREEGFVAGRASGRPEGFVECQKQANAALEKVKEAAYHDGYSVGQRNANECPGRIRDLERDLQDARRNAEDYRKGLQDTITKSASVYNEGYHLGRKDERAEIFGRHPWNEIAEQGKLIALLQGAKHESDARIDRLVKEVANANERVNTAYENGVTAGRAQVARTVTAAPEPEFRVGDVWRTSDGRVRCIVSITLGKIRYMHRILNGEVKNDSASDAREFRGNIGVNATVTRNAFSPARFSNEPKEGFMVGDVWTCASTQEERVIVVVTDTEVKYITRGNGDKWLHGDYWFTRSESNSLYRQEISTLIRK